MLKRRDWSLFQGQDGSGSEGESSDDGEDSQPEAASSASGSEGSDEDGPDGSQDGDEDIGGRLEDISEDDFEAKDLEEEAKTLKEQWLSGKKLSEDQLKAALACRLCKGVLLISPAALKNHIQSKRHVNKEKKKGEDYEAICLAKQLKGDNLETHQERLERLRKMSSEKDVAGKPKAEGQVKSKRAVRRALLKARKQAAKQAEGTQEPPKKGKPGKRQREALKDSKQDSGSKKKQKLEKTEDNASNQVAPDSKAPVSLPKSHKDKKKSKASNSSIQKSLVQDQTLADRPKNLMKKKEKKEKTGIASKANRAERRAVKQARLKAVKT